VALRRHIKVKIGKFRPMRHRIMICRRKKSKNGFATLAQQLTNCSRPTTQAVAGRQRPLVGLEGGKSGFRKVAHRREVSVGPAADAVAWLKEKWAAVKDHKYFLAPTPRIFRVAFFCALKAVLSASNRAFSVVRCL
jgi:hypothetical protein